MSSRSHCTGAGERLLAIVFQRTDLVFEPEILFPHPLPRRVVPPYKALRSRDKHFHSLHLKGKYELKLYQNSSVFTIRYLDELKQHLEREKWFPRGEVRAGRHGAGGRARAGERHPGPHTAPPGGPAAPRWLLLKQGGRGTAPQE
ncbi:hypothetical protein EVAR_14588_1 [Eumeta japonica]|uniref:Uncharacterized protein n=1 Tax=Eumeta variegata TaxID=151549 RepID=A0A4C1UV11_EUMVA|nr:hypothetical protein EVAR_14588_1 [Eumeta japonica]